MNIKKYTCVYYIYICTDLHIFVNTYIKKCMYMFIYL